MTRLEHLLTTMMEECDEVQKECSKALRFGLDDDYEGATVRQKLQTELAHVEAMERLLIKEGAIIDDLSANRYEIERKTRRVEEFLAYSKEKGRLNE